MSEIPADKKELAWRAWREAWNQKSSMNTMSELDESTARSLFERWWTQR